MRQKHGVVDVKMFLVLQFGWTWSFLGFCLGHSEACLSPGTREEQPCIFRGKYNWDSLSHLQMDMEPKWKGDSSTTDGFLGSMLTCRGARTPIRCIPTLLHSGLKWCGCYHAVLSGNNARFCRGLSCSFPYIGFTEDSFVLDGNHYLANSTGSALSLRAYGWHYRVWARIPQVTGERDVATDAASVDDTPTPPPPPHPHDFDPKHSSLVDTTGKSAPRMVLMNMPSNPCPIGIWTPAPRSALA